MISYVMTTLSLPNRPHILTFVHIVLDEFLPSFTSVAHLLHRIDIVRWYMQCISCVALPHHDIICDDNPIFAQSAPYFDIRPHSIRRVPAKFHVRSSSPSSY